MQVKLLTVCFSLLIVISYGAEKKKFWESVSSNHSYKYEPDIMEDYKKVDEEINEKWQELYDAVMAGYGYLKIEAEEELKRSVTWVKDFYENTTNEYEDALYDFEQTYISTSENPDYEFLLDIEEIVYSGLDDLEEECMDAAEDLENDYWQAIDELDSQQDDCEDIVEDGEQGVDDVMDDTESSLEDYVNDLNEAKWDLQEEEYETSEDIDDDIRDYYEEDGEDFENGEYAATNELINDISTIVEDFDTAPSYQDEYEQTISNRQEVMEEEDDQEDEEDDEDDEDTSSDSSTSTFLQKQN